MNKTQKKIVASWYKQLDSDYHDGTPEDPCPICVEAVEMGIIDDGEDLSNTFYDDREPDEARGFN